LPIPRIYGCNDSATIAPAHNNLTKDYGNIETVHGSFIGTAVRQGRRSHGTTGLSGL
jgi:hypothetical protein